jgi:hypothetical protein
MYYSTFSSWLIYQSINTLMSYFILYVLQGLSPDCFLLLVLNLQLLLVFLPILTLEVDKLPLLVLNHLGMLSLLNDFKVFLVYSTLKTVAFLHLNLFAITLQNVLV